MSAIPGNPEAPPFELSDMDRIVLSMTDKEFVPDTWEDLKRIIVTNQLADLRRYPSDLRRYMMWTHRTKAEYGNMTNYICQRRLHWVPSAQAGHGSSFVYNSSIPFTDPADFKILFNDWPYGFTPDISHLVVWSKTPISVKPETGEVTQESKALIEDFVDKTFVQRLAKEGPAVDRVMWFKNWTRLQSLRAVEHFHVLVRDVKPSILSEWTNGDVRDLSVMQD